MVKIQGRSFGLDIILICHFSQYNRFIQIDLFKKIGYMIWTVCGWD